MTDLSPVLQIIQIVLYFVGMAVFVIMLKADVRILRHDMATVKLRQDALNESLGVLTTVMTRVAVQDARMKSMEDSISELRRGRGHIQD